jgi:hypothetical protein
MRTGSYEVTILPKWIASLWRKIPSRKQYNPVEDQY